MFIDLQKQEKLYPKDTNGNYLKYLIIRSNLNYLIIRISIIIRFNLCLIRKTYYHKLYLCVLKSLSVLIIFCIYWIARVRIS